MCPGWICTQPEFLTSFARDLASRFGIHHVTVQLEDANAAPCAQAPADVV